MTVENLQLDEKNIMKRATAVFLMMVMLSATTAWAQCIERNIRFARGRTSTVIRGRVTSARSICYTLRIRDGQRMRVRVTSPSGRVRFGIRPNFFDADTIPGAHRVTEWEGVPESVAVNDYMIGVGIERGSDTFTLEVTVR